MDDDEDDIPALKPASKSQAELDRENEEMFRKAAEEDGKTNSIYSASENQSGQTLTTPFKKNAPQSNNRLRRDGASPAGSVARSPTFRPVVAPLT
jgi:hypothetical protein